MARKIETWKILHLVALSLFLLGSVFFVVDGVRGIVGGGVNVDGELVLGHQLTATTWTELQATYPGVADAIDLQNRLAGVFGLIIGLLMVAVLLTGFRKGERWAWNTMWVFPLMIVLIFLLLSTPATEPAFRSALWLWLVLPFVALALSYPTFFAKQGRQQMRPA